MLRHCQQALAEEKGFASNSRSRCYNALWPIVAAHQTILSRARNGRRRSSTETFKGEISNAVATKHAVTKMHACIVQDLRLNTFQSSGCGRLKTGTWKGRCESTQHAISSTGNSTSHYNPMCQVPLRTPSRAAASTECSLLLLSRRLHLLLDPRIRPLDPLSQGKARQPAG